MIYLIANVLPSHINTVKSQQQKRLGFNSAPLPTGKGRERDAVLCQPLLGLVHLLLESARSKILVFASAAGCLNLG